MSNQKQLNFYATPGVMTSSKKYEDQVKKLPNNIKQLVRIVQNLAIHMYVASSFYNIVISTNREDESHIRRFDEMLDKILKIEDKSLVQPRKPEKRLVGVCHHFAKILVSILRTKGIPARMRYGFGDYFNPGFYEDHSLCEYWNTQEGRWVLVDPQFDEIWQKELQIKHDVFDVPRDHFLVAGEAWLKCRVNQLDASKFGIFQGNMRGWWFIAGNIVKDIAALNKMEMLQWDAWAGMPRPNNAMRDIRRLAFFDELAKLTRDPDASFDVLRDLYHDESKKIIVPKRVFNAMRRHLEKVI